MEKPISELLSRMPEATIFLAVVVLIIFTLREYHKVRAETDKSINRAVDAKLGRIMSQIQTESEQFRQGLSEWQEKRSFIDKQFQEMRDEIVDKQKLISDLYSEIENSLKIAKASIPDVDEFSALDIYGFAYTSVDQQQKASFCKKILSHQDATSRELEAAGDMMREAGRVQLAKQLYERAHEIDPERVSVHIEKLALTSEIEYKQREDSLKQAMDICVGMPSVSAISRIANVLIRLNRYNVLLVFSEDLLAVIGNRSIALRVIALRNKAVALKEIGQTDEAIEVYKLAFSISPDDENTLKPYLSVLEEQGKGKGEEYLTLARRLIVIDPADISYYLIYISALMERRMYDQATKWLARADMLPKSGIEEARLREWEAKIKIATEIAASASD